MPPDLNWVLRVDGHTDHRKISTPEFPSNWELSTARAISVVRYAIERGIPPNRLAAAGFADNQPIDQGNTEDAYRRNRRIELKLTER
jgi:chemotaxis protein MotB